MTHTGTHISYLHVCHRKLWLFANGISMEHTSDLVAEGKLIDANSYPQRANRWQQLEIDGIKIDYFDVQNGIVREVKKSNKKESAHIAQLKYYLFVLERNEIQVRHGILEYPRLRITEEVWLTDSDKAEIPMWESAVIRIATQVNCPPLVPKSICKKCAYYDFCFSNEQRIS